MAVSLRLGYYRTGNSAIRSADPENHCLEPDMELIGCTVCEIFAFKVYCGLETIGFGVTQGHRKWHYSIEHIRLYIRLHSNYASVYYRFQDIAAYWSKIATPLYLASPLGMKPSDLRNDPW